MPTLQFKGRNIIWNHHLTVPYYTLDEVKELDVNPKKTDGNILVEGDNLLALKAMLPQYANSVKCIYIDPPYNTGKEDWVYNDQVNSPLLKEWLGKVVAQDDLTKHDKWLCMIVPRIKLLREFLTNDGIIFISLDNNEVFNFKSIADETFGEENFLGTIIIETATDNNPTQIATQHEYVLCYCKYKEVQENWTTVSDGAELIKTKYSELKKQFNEDIDKIQIELRKWIKENEKLLDKVSHYDNVDKIGVFHDGDIANTIFGGYKYDVKHPVTGKTCKIPEKGFRFPEATMKKLVVDNNIMFGPDEKTLIKPKKRIESVTDRLRSVIYEDGRAATKELETLFHKDFFKNPKSPTIIKRLLGFVTSENDLILDSFAGSGTTAQSMMELNKTDGGNRRFILVQMTEATKEEPKKNICKDITRERIKRAIDKYDYNAGFKYLRVGTPIDAETMLSGKLPTYKQFAKYVYYLCTGENLENEKEINEKESFVGLHGASAIHLIYTQDIDKLTKLALNLERAQELRKAFPKKRLIVYAPACFLSEEDLELLQIDFVGIPYNLFQRKS
jgi:adenine-specific DNA-methyltransferase